MSNFIELTNFDDGDVALINVDHIEFVTRHDSGGTVLVTRDGRGEHGEDRFYHVRERYSIVKNKLRSRVFNSMNIEMSEHFYKSVCDLICAHNQSCDDCPLFDYSI